MLAIGWILAGFFFAIGASAIHALGRVTKKMSNEKAQLRWEMNDRQISFESRLRDRDDVEDNLRQQIASLRDTVLTVPLQVLEARYLVPMWDAAMIDEPHFEDRVREQLGRMIESALIEQKVGWASDIRISRDDSWSEPGIYFKAELLVMQPRMLAPGEKPTLIGQPFEMEDGRKVTFVRSTD
jgi:hypothetical protein